MFVWSVYLVGGGWIFFRFLSKRVKIFICIFKINYKPHPLILNGISDCPFSSSVFFSYSLFQNSLLSELPFISVLLLFLKKNVHVLNLKLKDDAHQSFSGKRVSNKQKSFTAELTHTVC